MRKLRPNILRGYPQPVRAAVRRAVCESGDVDDRGDQPAEREPTASPPSGRAGAPGLRGRGSSARGSGCACSRARPCRWARSAWSSTSDSAAGRRVLGLPPFGALTADTHLSPLHLSATLQRRRRPAADGRRQRRGHRRARERHRARRARERSDVALRAHARRARSAATVLAALVYRRRWHPIAPAGVAALLAVAICEVLLLATFQPAAFTRTHVLGLARARAAADRSGERGDQSHRGPAGGARADRRRDRPRVHVPAGVAARRTTRSACCTSRTSTRRRSGWTSRRTWREGSTSTS